MAFRGCLAVVAALLMAPAALAYSRDVPLPPADVQAASTSTGITVSWQPPLYDGGFPIKSYTILRLTDPLHPTWEMVGTTDGTTTSWTDLGVGVLYAVTATNDAGQSLQSPPASAGNLGDFPAFFRCSPAGVDVNVPPAVGVNEDCLPVDIKVFPGGS
jgi:hypothetical protein